MAINTTGDATVSRQFNGSPSIRNTSITTTPATKLTSTHPLIADPLPQALDLVRVCAG